MTRFHFGTTCFFISNTFFSTYPHCWSTILWIDVLLWCCLIHITIIIYLVYLYQYLGLDLFMSNHDLFLIFSVIFIIMNHIIPLKKTHMFSVYFLQYHLSFSAPAKWIWKWQGGCHGTLKSIVDHHGWPTRKIFELQTL